MTFIRDIIILGGAFTLVWLGWRAINALLDFVGEIFFQG